MPVLQVGGEQQDTPQKDDERVALRRGWWAFGPEPRYWLTRFAILRGLGFIYLIAFFSLSQQLVPLIGARGLTPADSYLSELAVVLPGTWQQVWHVPSVFWLNASDGVMLACCWLGVALSVLVMLGLANVPMMALLWALYTSFVNVGQVWYGYGWESLLLEAGFLAIFLAPPLDPRPFSRKTPPPAQVIWLFRWLVFRVMFGAGLIKMRGDPCWRNLTCLAYHYTTQPLPNPVSYYLAAAPMWFDKLGVLFNHFVELIVPWFAFGPRRARHVAGFFLVLFQVLLILSGNLSFLNWLTIVVSLACFDDSFFERLVPRRRRWRERLAAWLDARREGVVPSRARTGVSWALVVAVAMLSIDPVVNMLSPSQMMNASFEPLRLVNTYGAFGSVGRVRHEVVIEGTADTSLGPDTRWREYELPCYPGDPDRRPCLVTPYHYRLDWQMWFAALGSYRQQPWIVHLVYELLDGNPTVGRLFSRDPFPDPAHPPHFVRVTYWRYEFTRPGSHSKAWWRRQYLGDYLPPLSRDDPRLHEFLGAHDWLPD